MTPTTSSEAAYWNSRLHRTAKKKPQVAAKRTVKVLRYSKRRHLMVKAKRLRWLLKVQINAHGRVRRKNPASADRICREVCDYTGITWERMSSKRKTRDVSNARQMAIFLMKKHTRWSYQQISHRFGGRDHSTAVHAVQNIKKNLKLHEMTIKSIEANCGLLT